MFFCDPCSKDQDWPQSMMRSYGRCEVCSRVGNCNDVPSRLLPVVELPEKPVSIDRDAVERALRALLADIDYDLHKSWEVDETDGKNYYHVLVDSFVEEYHAVPE